MPGGRYTRQSPFAANLRDSPVTIAILAINFLAWLAMEAGGGTGGLQGTQNLYDWGAKYGPSIADGEWWRLIVPMFMHIGFFHLFANSIGLFIFGSVAERTFGSRGYLAIYLLSGVLGNVASFWAGPTLGAGASGAVFGIVGAFAVYLMLNRRMLGRMGRESLTAVAFIIGINLVFGATVGGIDNFAHLGGLLAGGAMALLIAPRERLFVSTGLVRFDSPYVGMRTVHQNLGRVAVAVAIAITLAIVLTMIKSNGYSEPNQFALLDALLNGRGR